MEVGVFAFWLTACRISPVTQVSYLAGSAAPECGVASSKGLESAPSEDTLCKGGKASKVNGNGPWDWTCGDQEKIVSCAAQLLVKGACGPANGVHDTSDEKTAKAPEGAALCTKGTATSVKDGTGPLNWIWSCNGENGGTAANCSQTLAAPGQCGSAASMAQLQKPSDGLCSSGAPTPVTGAGPWNWSCSGINGGASSSCVAQAVVSGSCGTANGGSFLSAPTTMLCSSGMASAVTGTGPFYWSCNGSNGGTSQNCTAKRIINGVCGISNMQNRSTAPTVNLCRSGTASTVLGSGPWTWTCMGANTGTNASCSANKIINGVCGLTTPQPSIPTTGLCSGGSPTTVTGTGPWSWSCNGSNGGTNASCTVNVMIAGVCGTAAGVATYVRPTANLCSTGVASEATSGKGVWNWTCAGQNGGAQASCRSGGLQFTRLPNQPGLIGAADIFSVFVDSGKIYAGSAGGLSISTDGGNTWDTKNQANGLANTGAYGIVAEGNTVYAITGQKLAISRDGGNTWVIKTSADGLGSDSASGVHLSNNTAYVVTGGGVSISTDGGNTWVYKAIPGSYRPFKPYVANGTIYVTSIGSGLYLSVDGGNTWMNKTTANGLYSDFVSGLYSVGSTVYATTGGHLSVSKDGGNTWTVSAQPQFVQGSIYGTGSTLYAPTLGGVAVSLDAGKTWSYKTEANGLGSRAVNAVYGSGGTIYAATRNGLAISTNSGSNWVYKSSGIGSDFINNVYVANGVIYVATSEGGLSFSTDGGATWVNKTVANGLGDNTVNRVFVSGTTLYASTQKGMSVSTNSGSTWVNKNVVAGFSGGLAIDSVYVSGSAIYLASGGGITMSKDGGATWVTTNPANDNLKWYYCVTGSGTSIYAGTYRSGLLHSVDGGYTWVTQKPTSGTYAIVDVYLAGSNVYAAMENGGLSISTDGGTTWVNKTRDNGLGDNAVSAVYATGSVIYAGTINGLSISGDGGNTWLNQTTLNGLASSDITGVYGGANGKIYIATRYAGLYVMSAP